MSTDLFILNITGKLTESTPLFVVLEIADSMEISYDKSKTISGIISEIHSKVPYTLNKPYKDIDYQKMALFVNPYVDWDIVSLETATKYLLNFQNPDTYITITIDSKFGLQTPEYPNNIPNIIVYTLCKYYNLDLTIQTTEKELHDILHNFLKSRDMIKDVLYKKLDKMSDLQLLKTYNFLTKLQ